MSSPWWMCRLSCGHQHTTSQAIDRNAAQRRPVGSAVTRRSEFQPKTTNTTPIPNTTASTAERTTSKGICPSVGAGTAECGGHNKGPSANAPTAAAKPMAPPATTLPMVNLPNRKPLINDSMSPSRPMDGSQSTRAGSKLQVGVHAGQTRFRRLWRRAGLEWPRPPTCANLW